MKRLLLLSILTLAFILLLSGCVSSHYLVKVQYGNANTGDIEYVDVPMSEYHYNNTQVGDNFELTIHTIILGIRVPITEYTSSGGIALVDVAPLAIPFFSLFPFVLPALNDDKQKRRFLRIIIPLTISAGLSIFLVNTTAPDFTTIGQVIDKTSGIW